MLTQYIGAALGLARYELMEDGRFFAEIAELPGVWADGASLEECRETLREVVEDWIMLGLKHGDELPVVGGFGLRSVGNRVA
ncbi:MAG: type II toxin-antitoxin system HicB family antitoxin [Dehalococcoidia bacterium]|nr:type II toxin-antitoxin system HicB family antitoxin [Dehalococcoidia bacterium]